MTRGPGSRDLLIISPAEYSEAETEVIAAFEQGGSTIYVVKVGLKAQTVKALLVRTSDGWKVLIRPADYPLLC